MSQSCTSAGWPAHLSAKVGRPGPAAVQRTVERIVTVHSTDCVEVPVERVVERIVQVPQQTIVEVPTPLHSSTGWCFLPDRIGSVVSSHTQMSRKLNFEASPAQEQIPILYVLGVGWC